MNYNWHKYKVLVKGNFKEDDISVTFSNNKSKTNKFIEKAIDESYKEVSKNRLRAKLNVDYFESKIYRLENFQYNGNKLDLVLGTCLFKELQGTNASHSVFGDIYGKEFLANGLLVQALVKTRDGKYILGRRVSDKKKENEELAIFGGTADLDEGLINNGKDLFEKIRIELRQELGVDDYDISKLELNYLVEDWKYYPIFYFYTELNISQVQLEDKFKNLLQDEHSELGFYTKEDLLEKIKIQEENFSDLTLTCLDLFLN